MSTVEVHPIARWGVAVIATLGALSAIAGGFILAAWPDGSVMKLPLDMLQGTSFSDFRIPGLLLLIVIGGTQTVAAVLAFLDHPFTGVAGLVAGIGMMIWMGVELAMVGYGNVLQPIYFAEGIALATIASRLHFPDREELHLPRRHAHG